MNFSKLKPADRYRLIRRRLMRIYGKRQLGLTGAIALALEESKKAEFVQSQICEATNRPVSCGPGMFYSAESELARCKESGDLVDMSLIGDLSTSFEFVTSGPSKSPLKLDKTMVNRQASSSIMCEFWLSHLFPVYVFDMYGKAYNRSTMTWRFQPIAYKKGGPGFKVVRNVERTLRRSGYFKVSKKFCSIPVKTPYIKSRTGTPRVFDCLFTNVAGNTRLVFNGQGFRTESRGFGSNWSSDANRVIAEVAERKLPDTRVSWKEKYGSSGDVVRRTISYTHLNGDVLSVEQNQKNEILSLQVNGSVVWNK